LPTGIDSEPAPDFTASGVWTNRAEPGRTVTPDREACMLTEIRPATESTRATGWWARLLNSLLHSLAAVAV